MKCRSRSAAPGLLGLWAALCLSAGPARAAITVAMTPAAVTVAPGAEFEVTIQVTAAGSAFNAFDTRVAFDPAALTPVQLSPVQSQIGSLFTANCSNLFHRFSAGAAEDTAGCSMLCNGVSTTGPGTVYRLRFRASNTVQQTVISFAQLRFYQAGLFVLPVTSSPTGVGIGMAPPTVGAPPLGASDLALSVGPSPVRSEARFAFSTPRPGRVTLDVFDVNGRRVRRVLDEFRPAGASTVAWPAVDAAGVRVPAGAYFAVLDAAGGRLTRKLVVLQ